MQKPEPVDEYAQTEVLVPSRDPAHGYADVLSLYAEYESELAREAQTRRESRTRR